MADQQQLRASMRSSAWMNVAVFTPITLYALSGKRPPSWLLVASTIYAVGVLASDVSTLLEPAPPALNELPEDLHRVR